MILDQPKIKLKVKLTKSNDKVDETAKKTPTQMQP
jgi:hypothetical protein